MTETYTATLDRIVDGQTAVLLLEDDEEIVAQLDIDVTRLPEDGQHEGAVLEVTVDDELFCDAEYVPETTIDDRLFCDAEYLPETTQSRRESAQERLDRLSTRLSDRD